MNLPRFAVRWLTPREWRLLITVVLVLGAFARPISGETTRSLELTTSITRHHTVALDPVLVEREQLDPNLAQSDGFPEPRPNDPRYEALFGLDRAWADGHFYRGKAPGLAVLLVPLVWAVDAVAQPTMPSYWAIHEIRNGVLSWLSAIFLMAPLTALSVLLVHRTHERVLTNSRAMLFLTLVYAFGTWTFYYGTLLNAWQVINCLTWLGIYYGFVRERLTFPGALLVGTTNALAVSMNYFAGVLLPVLLLGMLLHRGKRAAFLAGVGFAIGILPLIAYHWKVFGHPLSTPYAHRIDALVAETMESGVQGFNFPSPRIALLLLLGPCCGIALYVPASILAAKAYQARRSHLVWIGASGFLLIWLFLAGRHQDYHSGQGCGFGTRYWMPVLPFVWLLVLEGARRSSRSAFELLGMLSIFIGAVGAMFAPNYVHTTIAEFFIKGFRIPFLDWLNDILLAYTQRRPPVSSLGVISFLSLLLWLVWRKKPLPLG